MLSNILSNIGYGGFIHHFKNAILRLDIDTLAVSEEQIKNALYSISTYKKTYPLQSDFLNHIEKTLLLYKTKIEQVESFINEGKDSKSIDKQVAVDDSFAMESVNEIITFRNKLATVIAEESLETEEYIYFTIWLNYLLISITFIIFFIVIRRFFNSSVSSLNKQNILFELAPLAILAIDKNGKITSANNEAYRIFNAKTGSLINSSIDELIPDDIKVEHIDNHSEYQKSEKTHPISARRKRFQAKKCTGELFPANISIATYDQHNNKEAIAIIEDITNYVKSYNDAHTDTLTNLPNRRDIEANLARAITLCKRANTQLYLALIDIDFFKKINDDFGHEYGDQVLKHFALIMREAIRESDFVGRWGGEEFLLIIEDSTDEGAFNVCEKIRLSVEEYFLKQKRAMTVSIGLTRYIKNEDEKILFERVDKALYTSKNNGRNKSTFM